MGIYFLVHMHTVGLHVRLFSTHDLLHVSTSQLSQLNPQEYSNQAIYRMCICELAQTVHFSCK